MILVLHPERQIHAEYLGKGSALFDPRRFNEVAQGLREPFSQYIDSLSRQHPDSIDWWVTTVASRNTIAGSAFLNLAYLLYADEVLERNEVNLIVCKSRGLQTALLGRLRELGRDIRVVRREGVMQRLRHSLPAKLVRGGCFLARGAKRKRAAAASARLSGKRSFAGTLHLLDVFVLNNSFDGCEFSDRYYGSLRAVSSDLDWVYLPFLHEVQELDKVFLQMRGGEAPFLIKEDYLNPVDYLWAFAHLLRRPFLKVDTGRFLGLDVAPIILEDLHGPGVDNAMEALLEYRLPRRLREAGVEVSLLLNWFENQVIDKALHAGFTRYYPKTRRVGYQGFIVTPFYLCAYPTEQERLGGVLPQEVAVMGSALVEPARTFCRKLPVFVAPAFRFSNVWKGHKRAAGSGTLRILVCLPIMIDESIALLETVCLALSGLPGEIFCSIKPHPTMPADTMAGLVASLGGRARVVGGDFSERLAESDLLISNTSSTCVETVAHGVPVIVVGNRTAITQNPIPPDMAPQLWRVCYTVEEMRQEIAFFAAINPALLSGTSEEVERIRGAFFEQMTPENILKLNVKLRGEKVR